jgi:hypothetical protein
LPWLDQVFKAVVQRGGSTLALRRFTRTVEYDAPAPEQQGIDGIATRAKQGQRARDEQRAARAGP